MSSTAIAMQSVQQRAITGTDTGRATLVTLLVQDLAVIPILALIPVLAATRRVDPALTKTAIENAADAATNPYGWWVALVIIGGFIAVTLASRYLMNPLMRWVAMAKVPEAFTALGLLLVIGAAFATESMGLSPALGAFLAGVLLADSEYRHELEGNLEPFKGLLLGLFFMSVGAQIDFALIASRPLVLAGLVLGTMALKLIVLHVLGRMFGLDRPARWLLAIALAQVGEFAFVLLSFAVQERIFSPELASTLVATVAISMVATPPAFIMLERFVLPRVTDRGAQRPADEIVDDGAPVVIAGYGRFGQMVGRMLRANRIKVTILDLDPEMVDVLGRLGIKAYYGDASRVDLLHAAGCEHAKLFVLAVDDAQTATTITENVRQHFPHLTILARCVDRPHYWALRSLGVRKVFRETFGSAYETGIEALKHLGFRAHTAHRLAQRWRKHEEASLEELGDVWRGGDRDAYFKRARGAMDEAERLMREEDPTVYAGGDPGWNNESLRADPEIDAAAIDETS
jgi:Kef-type K+ transport system membrane component KefB/voltage-gated potassium channel Kch